MASTREAQITEQFSFCELPLTAEPEGCSTDLTWTPGHWSGPGSDSSQENVTLAQKATEERDEVLENFNMVMTDMCSLSNREKLSPLPSRINLAGLMHDVPSTNESIYDQLRRQWARQFGTISVHKNTAQSILPDTVACPDNGKRTCPTLSMGWALHEPASKARFPEAVKKYLTAKFNLGERTGEKVEPHQVAQDMRNARNENGDRLFT